MKKKYDYRWLAEVGMYVCLGAILGWIILSTVGVWFGFTGSMNAWVILRNVSK